MQYSTLLAIPFLILGLMRKTLLFLLILTGASGILFSYFTLLTDWVNTYFIDMNSHNYLKAVLESAVLLMYIYSGIKFFNRHVGSMR